MKVYRGDCLSVTIVTSLRILSNKLRYLSTEKVSLSSELTEFLLHHG